MKTFFITGTGTDVGKTLTTCTFAWQLRQKGKRTLALKPVVSGVADLEGSDTGHLLAAQGIEPTIANARTISPWRFSAALSPDMAARAENKEIEMEALLAFCRQEGHDYLIIESAGGIMSPLGETHTMLDWAQALGSPVILVAGSYLGTLSHILTACEALASHKVPLHGIVMNESAKSAASLKDLQASLARFLPEGVPVQCIGRLAPSPQMWKNAPDITPMVL